MKKLFSKFLVMLMMVSLNHFAYAGIVPSNSNLVEATKSAESIKPENVKKQKKFKIKWHQKLLLKVFGKKMVEGSPHWSNIASLCCGIAGFISILFLQVSFYSFFSCLCGIGYGIYGLIGDKKGKGMGIAGIITGGLGLLLYLLIIMIAIALVL